MMILIYTLELINVGLNNLFGEDYWFYPTGTSVAVNRHGAYLYYYMSLLHKDLYGQQDIS